ncbi:MAG: CDP-alcohol phosphatidyltransferase family protein [Candidatus Saccharibacteria bacterium]|nr:CDP-alcohol phosphatidyltransferase family protein [Candidatus Saccharibacteria bacterium]
MAIIDNVLDIPRDLIRSLMRRVASWLHAVSGGRLSPNLVTYTGLIAHLPIAWLISQGYFGYAAFGLVFFGLFDTLDGELARLQNKASNAGMLLDATTDRMKETILYAGVAYVFVLSGQPYYAVWAVTAVGGSILVSYVKAKGETAVKDLKLTPNQINRLFSDGLMRFEVRMALLVVALLLNYLAAAIVIITLLTWVTALGRLFKISRKLTAHED